jgi:hypothetical protein
LHASTEEAVLVAASSSFVIDVIDHLKTQFSEQRRIEDILDIIRAAGARHRSSIVLGSLLV